MKYLKWLLLLAVLPLGCRQDPDKGATNDAVAIEVQLLCESLSDSDVAPLSAVYVLIQHKKTKLLNMSASCSYIAPDAYESYAIPAEALSAVGGWWAGVGDYLYARPDGASILIYHAAIDETMAGDAYPYELIATYANGKFLVKTIQ